MRIQNGDRDTDKWRMFRVAGTGTGKREKNEQVGRSDGTVN